jgi:NADH-quinone oxidoreductase subunit E
LFTLETVACLGCCSLAPVMMIDETTYGRLTPDEVRKILKSYQRQAQPGQENQASESAAAAASGKT